MSADLQARMDDERDAMVRRERLTPQDANVVFMRLIFRQVMAMKLDSPEIHPDDVRELERARGRYAERLRENLRYAEKQSR